MKWLLAGSPLIQHEYLINCKQITIALSAASVCECVCTSACLSPCICVSVHVSLALPLYLINADLSVSLSP